MISPGVTALDLCELFQKRETAFIRLHFFILTNKASGLVVKGFKFQIFLNLKILQVVFFFQ